MHQSRYVFLFVLLATSAISQAHARAWERLYAFGDSYTDSGAGYVDGNGPTAVVYLAAALNIPFTHAADANSSGKGINFAVSGAQTGSGDGVRMRPATAACGAQEALIGRGMQTQVQEFSRRVHAGTIRFDPQKTLFFLAGGLNDASLPTATSISNLEAEVRALHELGAKYVMVALMPTKLSPRIKSYIALNKSIQMIPHHMQSELPGTHVVVSGWGEYFDEVFANPKQYGIANTTDRCAGRALYGEDTTPCPTPDAYFYYHEGHPSTAVHKIVGLRLHQEVMRLFP